MWRYDTSSRITVQKPQQPVPLVREHLSQGLLLTRWLRPGGDGDGQPQDQYQYSYKKTETVGIFVAAGRERGGHGIEDHEAPRNVQRGSRRPFPFRQPADRQGKNCGLAPSPLVGEWIGPSECFGAEPIARRQLPPVRLALSGLFPTGAGRCTDTPGYR